MRFLDRSQAPAPTCLASFDHRHHTWDDVTAADRAAIRAGLTALHGRRCAYCEGSLDQLDEHIEHLCQRSRHPNRTFDWANLFLSCTRMDSCGKHKDTCGQSNAACADHANHCHAYECKNLIDPGREEPERFFRFLSDGSIVLRSGLSDDDAFRARETLRVFSLDARHGRLRKMRARAVSGHQQTIADLGEYAAALPASDWLPFLKQELAAARDQPFSTAIKHALIGSTK